MAPLIRISLLTLYLSLVLPLPLLAPASLKLLLSLAVAFGLLLVGAISSERVLLSPAGISVGYPRWCGWAVRRGWSLAWAEVQGLTPVTTSQGGRVFYVRTRSQGRSYLLPQRVARFDDFLQRFSQASGSDCRSVQRLTPAWTYQLLATMSALLLIGEIGALLRHSFNLAAVMIPHLPQTQPI